MYCICLVWIKNAHPLSIFKTLPFARNWRQTRADADSVWNIIQSDWFLKSFSEHMLFQKLVTGVSVYRAAEKYENALSQSVNVTWASVKNQADRVFVMREQDHTHRHRHTHSHTHTLTHTHTHTRTRMHARTHAHRHTHTRTRTHAHTHSHRQTDPPPHTHTHTHTDRHTDTHTHTHTHTHMIIIMKQVWL